MSMTKKAPVLYHSGDKNQHIESKPNTFYAYSPDFFADVCNCLGAQDTIPMKVMLYLAGNSGEGKFGVAEKTICDACGISKKRYYAARNKLVEMGWLKHFEGSSITVCFNKVFDDYRHFLKLDTLTTKKSCADTLTTISVVTLSQFGGTPCPDLGGQGDYYNNISNNINNKIKNKIDVPDFSSSAPIGATQEKSGQPQAAECTEKKGKKISPNDIDYSDCSD